MVYSEVEMLTEAQYERGRKNYDKVRKLTTDGVRSKCHVCGDEFFHTRPKVMVCGEGYCKKFKHPRSKPFTLPHFKWWAKHVILDNGKPWKLDKYQELFISDMLSAVNGTPRYGECWLLIPEENGKTTTFAGIGLYHAQHRKRARVPMAASSRDQAELMFGQAAGMIDASEFLQPAFRAMEGYRRIVVDSIDSRIQVFAADDRTADGAIFTLALIDELHRHRDLKLYRTWSGKRRKRGGQLLTISTAGEPGSDFEDTRKKIRTEAVEKTTTGCFTRAVNGAVLMHEYAVPEEGDIEDLTMVKQANPFSGMSVADLKEKRASITMTTEHWARFTCNRAVRGISAGVPERVWAEQKTDRTIPEGVSVWLGLDVAWMWDTLAAVPMWAVSREWRMFGPAEILETPRDGATMLPSSEVEAMLRRVHERNPIVTLVMDTTRAEQLAQWCADEFGCEVVSRGQSNALACLDYENFLEGLRTQTLWHSGDPGLTSHVMNAIARTLPDDKKRFDRPASGRVTSETQAKRRYIDALVAAAMANTVFMGDKPQETTSWRAV